MNAQNGLGMTLTFDCVPYNNLLSSKGLHQMPDRSGCSCSQNVHARIVKS